MKTKHKARPRTIKFLWISELRAWPFTAVWLFFFCALFLVAGCREEPPQANATNSTEVTFKPQEMADALHAVIAANREQYSLQLVQRLCIEEKVLNATGNWKQDKALPLPAQMLRMESEAVQQKGAEFHYVLRSLWPINPKNAPETDTERLGLQFVAEHPDTNYYAAESLGGRRYFTAVYADTALCTACVDCHNRHQESPRTNFRIGEVMGGIIVRVPLEF